MNMILVPACRHTEEILIANSRFIATIGRSGTVEQAKDFIRDVSSHFADATHNIPVFRVGSGASVTTHCSDAGEPSGTAGRPALAVLEGSGLSDAVLVISRYFGGTKLGTGGLVKAYSAAARAAVEGVPRAQKLFASRAGLELPYNLYDQVTRTIRQHAGVIEKERFTDQISLEYLIAAEHYEQVEKLIVDLSSGSLKPRLIQAAEILYIPV